MPDRPRVLLVLTEFPPRVGGMQTHALYLCQHLAQRGYPIEVVTYRPGDAEEFGRTAETDARLLCPVHRNLSRLGYWHNLDILVEHASRFRPDLVYSSTVFYGLLGSQIGVPVICRSVGNDVLRPWIAYPFRPGSAMLSTPWLEHRLYTAFQHLRRPDWVASLFRQARHDLMARAANQAACVLANSTFTAGLLHDVGLPDEQIEVLVGGVDARRFARSNANRQGLRAKLGLPADRYLLVTTCRLEPKKGVDFLLGVLPALLGEMPDAHLVVVGDGPQGAAYRALVDRFGLAARVTFAGRVPHEEVHAYYWAADLFVLTSREHVNPRIGLRDVETMGRVLCEANAAGVPVIATRSGGIPSVVVDGENGLLFDPDDAAGLVRQVLRVREQPDLVARLTEAGERAARTRFDWSVILDAHERVFDRILTESAYRAGATSHAWRIARA